jgi:DNA-binding response OmpR family regulator
MTKPFSAAELLEKMRELLNGGAPDGPRATV